MHVSLWFGVTADSTFAVRAALAYHLIGLAFAAGFVAGRGVP